MPGVPHNTPPLHLISKPGNAADDAPHLNDCSMICTSPALYIISHYIRYRKLMCEKLRITFKHKKM
ncbi:hypothetical protein E2C01_021920 [Portunus trituberculatus]|uniref:Uncharacterized protein n=1 Tax=Portunus trituberculatus TaxID=210409 RepID=A0A5B7E420_PORTR|nr:hypothetical protein [Portunus trituberculatus]